VAAGVCVFDVYIILNAEWDQDISSDLVLAIYRY